MKFFLKSDPKRVAFPRNEILAKAEKTLAVEPFHITDAVAPMSEGGIHDYYSASDYWWPNPDTPDGLPYVRRDGETNPEFFVTHRRFIRNLSEYVADLAGAYRITGEDRFAAKAARLLKEFFLDEATKMNPNLRYAQAIPGVCSGRGVGIIDTLHLIDVPVAVGLLQESPAFPEEVAGGLIEWFSDYLEWITRDEYGISEMNRLNNHGICWSVQAAVFARFTGNPKVIEFLRERYRNVQLPEQMAEDGSFPEELARTKPYGYSIFVADNLTTLCHVLSEPGEDLWEFVLEDGRCIKKGIDFIVPYMREKERWPHPPDVQHFEGWPSRISFLLFAGLAFHDDRYLELWQALPEPEDDEVRRNTAIKQPFIWLA